MANSFVQNVGDGGAAAARYSAFMSSVLEAATRTAEVGTVTQTNMETDSSYTTTADSGQAFASTAQIDSYTTPYSTGYPGTTLATQTYSSQNNVQQTSSPESTDTPLPYSDEKDDDEGLSDGQLAAAIVVPIVLTAILALLAFLILRRRRRSRQEQARPDSSSSINKVGFFGLREKWGSLKSSASSQKSSRPEVTSPHNNSYMTGLDTSSRSTSPQDDEPPPYMVDMTNTSNEPALARNFSHPRPSNEMTQLRIPQQSNTVVSPVSPVSPLSPHSNDLLSPNPSFLQVGNRPGSSRSINSDAYSDTASIHSARAARMSVGGPTVMLAPAINRSRSLGDHDPFDDPNSPVPSLPDDALRRLEDRRGSAESKDSEIEKEVDV